MSKQIPKDYTKNNDTITRYQKEPYTMTIWLDLDSYYDNIIYDYLCDHDTQRIKDLILEEAINHKINVENLEEYTK